MRVRLRDDSGFALATAMLILLIVIGLGLGITAYADSQQGAARIERSRESSFNQAEAVLNAQIFQLARSWPTSSALATSPCRPTTPGAGTSATTCPDPASLASTFAGPDYTAAARCSPAAWQTVVQDDNPAAGGTTYYDPVAMNPANPGIAAGDANGNNSFWVRATAAPDCPNAPQRQTVVALVTRALTPLDWPHSVLTADWFQTSNQGNKVIINTLGPNSAQPGDVSLRCAGHTGGSCKQYKAGQVAPDTIPSSPPGGTPVLNATQLDSLRQQAKLTSTWYSACPSSVALGSLAQGTVVFVEGSPTCSTSASGNTAAKSVAFVVRDGRFSIGGNSKFYGLLYMANASNQSTPLVSLSGCAKIQGMVAVDGLGGVDVGSCKQNLTYDPGVLGTLRTTGGAVLAKNSFRELAAGTP